MSIFSLTLRRDLLLVIREPAQGMAVLAFFVMAASLFPIGVGPESALLRRIAPGIIWVAALLAVLLGLPRLFEADFLDGTLEQMVVGPVSLGLLVLGKIVAHWLSTGVPIVLLSPLLAIQFSLDRDSLLVMVGSLLPGTLLLSLIGAIGSALTLGLRNSGVLVTVLVLPLYVPVLVFGAGALEADLAGMDAAAHLYLLVALLALALFFAPWVTAAALRIALE